MTRQHTAVAGGLLAIVVAGLFSMLGLWQLQRMHEKQALLAQAAPGQVREVSVSRAAAAPQTLHWVRDRMYFLPGTVLLDNQLRDGQAGVKVYQAARADSGPAVLVDLGWLPLPPSRALPVIVPQQGWHSLQGLWAPAPSAGIALGPALAPVSAPQTWLATRIDLQAIATQLGLQQSGLAPRVLRLDPALPLGYTRDLDLLPNTLPPSRHLGYAVQWFALALAVLSIAAVLYWRRPR